MSEQDKKYEQSKREALDAEFGDYGRHILPKTVRMMPGMRIEIIPQEDDKRYATK